MANTGKRWHEFRLRHVDLWLGLVFVIAGVTYATAVRLSQLSAWERSPALYVASGVPMMTTLDAYYSLRIARLQAAGVFVPHGPVPARHYARPQQGSPGEWYDPARTAVSSAAKPRDRRGVDHGCRGHRQDGTNPSAAVVESVHGPAFPVLLAPRRAGCWDHGRIGRNVLCRVLPAYQCRMGGYGRAESLLSVDGLVSDSHDVCRPAARPTAPAGRRRRRRLVCVLPLVSQAGNNGAVCRCYGHLSSSCGRVLASMRALCIGACRVRESRSVG